MERVSARAGQDRPPGSRRDARVCAWCGDSVARRPDGSERPTSHGICPSCLAELLAALPPADALRADLVAIVRSAPRRHSR
jgi:hypothetical protein